jgi:2-dehydro-3-deoxygluconokinase
VMFMAQQPGALEHVGSFAQATAGAELNVATGLARLGLRVGYVSRLGDDSFGRHLAAFMDREGIDCRHVAIDPLHPTGFMLKSLATDGSDPRIEYHRRGSAASRLGLPWHAATAGGAPGAGRADEPVVSRDAALDAYCAASRHLHLTGICPALSASARALVFELAGAARAAGRSVSFDPNLRPRLWPSEAAMRDTLNALAALSDWVLPGLAEGRVLTGCDSPEGIADFYLARGARVVVVKLGAAGAHYATATERGLVAGVPVARVVDTVGAGDGFAVGVVSALLDGLALRDAVARGNAIGARVVQYPGDSDGLPTRAELEAALAGSGAPPNTGAPLPEKPETNASAR